MLQIDQYPQDLQIILKNYWQRLLDAKEKELSGAQSLVELVEQDVSFASELSQVWSASDFVANITIQNPQLLVDLKTSGELERSNKNDFYSSLIAQLEPLSEQDKSSREALVKQTLRCNQKKQMARIIWRDVCAKSDIVESCADISALADSAIEAGLSVVHKWEAEKWGEPGLTQNGERQTLIVLGMGKLGAGELNLSSDVDLIFAYPENGQTQGGEDGELSNQQFFTRVGQKLIDVLDTITSDGFVNRVDMRLRPYGSEGALVCSFDAMESYYQTQGRDWERYALIKARIVAGSQELGAHLLGQLRPFVYRRYLDFSAFDSLRSMKLQINKQVRRKGLSNDVKLGAGGIREIEFIVQAIQLVHGGRDDRLQKASLFAAMNSIVEGEYLPAEVIEQLRDAYRFLRSLEHKLQGLANKQTQMLVSQAIEQARIAHSMGFENWELLSQELERHRANVRLHFAAVVSSEEESDDESEQELGDWSGLWREDISQERAIELLAQHEFESPEETLQLLMNFRKEKSFLVLPAESRQRFNKFMPVLLAALADSDQPSLGAKRVMTLIQAVSRRTAYLVLLLENPPALRQVIQLCSASPFVTEYLSKFPVLLDEMLDGIEEPPGKAELQEELAQQLLRIDPEDFEEQMELLRYFKLSHTLQVAAAQISGRLTVMKVSDYLTFTAEAILEQVLALSWDVLVSKHGYPVDTSGRHGEMGFAIIAYGKMGGIELSYVSDLDLVFLHNGALDKDTIVTEGQRSINSREFYTRLAQRVIMMLSTQTVSGDLYEVDMRLRPSGESGLLVSSMEAFAKYQDQDAWTWEHQALVRARAVAGSPQLHEAFYQQRALTLGASRDVAAVAGEVTHMRQRMRTEFAKKPKSEREKVSFIIKHGLGGIVDIEFMVQFLVLCYSSQHKSLLTYSDNVRILESAHECGLLSNEQFESLTDAYLALRSALHQFALAQQNHAELPATLLEHQQAVSAVWDAIFNTAK
ncbi:MAG: bifunctional [glutamate--ammonia ligase]-adenylyl-L-tyrosine phosphorylase/[glutamate--ammonia-ligase] adenylyltransferase [Pseudohongiellaceae bacterium]|nr:bifunctional [glutamate--ammonia ligase]-adenylyl-L-tyrosine phosphorylase/[glutamate--ammonia-ligase] adenylyltransferase [Pseudohongiellaceae bacterium]